MIKKDANNTIMLRPSQISAILRLSNEIRTGREYDNLKSEVYKLMDEFQPDMPGFDLFTTKKFMESSDE